MPPNPHPATAAATTPRTVSRAPEVSRTAATSTTATTATTTAATASGDRTVPRATATRTGTTAANTAVRGDSTLIGPIANAA
ncbi:hypothetical protein [Curtobacterium sp. PhB146]|uniref:hypothetical protein n=1 Tax=Curtobacterium sp. PhB146 TaxID=2485187 RepID=UPI001042F137|nr:hypothetical protein [Curtobacterium sp. PhB146]TCU50547.1 hypothetical protein EDF33_1011049 [Curtobacterium sp. PhB146]